MPATQPVRRDVLLYNESLALFITSRRACGRYEFDPSDPDDVDRQKAAQRGVYWAVELTQDDAPACRVILGDALSPEEEAEVVGHAAGRLAVPDGKLVLAGGQEPFTDGLDDLDPEDDFPPVVVLPVPKGDYRLDLYALCSGVNGPRGRRADTGEELVDWYRRTRPGRELPGWLRSCDESDVVYLDFLLRLTPLATADPLPAGDWFGPDGVVPARPPVLPAVCPLGLPADLPSRPCVGGE